MNSKTLKLRVLSAAMCLSMLMGTSAIGITASAASSTGTTSSVSSSVTSITDSTSPKMQNGKKITAYFNGSAKKATVYNIEEGTSITFNVKTNVTSAKYKFEVRNVKDTKYTVKRSWGTGNSYKFTFNDPGQYIIRTIIKDNNGNTKTRYYNIDVNVGLRSTTSISSKNRNLTNIVAGQPTTFSAAYPTNKYKIEYKRHANKKWVVMKDYSSTKNKITFQSSDFYDLRFSYKAADGTVKTRNYTFTPKQTGNIVASFFNRYDNSASGRYDIIEKMQITATLINSSGKVISTQRFDATGKVSFKGVVEGTYKLSVQAAKAPKGFLADNDSFETTVVVKNQQITWVKIPMRNEPARLGSVSLYITDEEQTRIHSSSYSATVYDTAGNKVLKESFNDNGSVTLKLLPGQYKIIVDLEEAPAEYQISTQPFEITVKVNGNAQGFVVEPIIKTPMTAPVALVTFEGTRALAGYTFNVYDSNDKLILQNQTFDDEGKATMRLARGKYKAKIISAPIGYSLSDKTFSFKVASSEVNISLAEFVQDIGIFNYVSRGSIEVRLTGENNDISGVLFELYDQNTNLVFKSTTNQNGVICWNNIPCGNYTVKMIKTPTGYTLDDNTYQVQLSQNGEHCIVSVPFLSRL